MKKRRPKEELDVEGGGDSNVGVDTLDKATTKKKEEAKT